MTMKDSASDKTSRTPKTVETKRILDRITGPQDLKGLSLPQLTQLAGEVRELIIQTVAKTGGHLASSLGVVELTVALHYLFDSPTDKIVWDVGHQTYGHKILTGRKDSIHTLRQAGGLSGFTNIFESEHDHFGAGHASTSISAALGLAQARDQLGQDNSVIAVIGDGSLTGGLAFEALNNVGSTETNLLVIVNDNEMSISKNVGAMVQYFNKAITSKFYNRAKADLEGLIHRIPHVGGRLRTTLNRFQEGLKVILVPGILFEELGFRYFGPIDGHDLGELIGSLQRVRQLEGPRVLHVITQKGKGFLPAEEDPLEWHGAVPFVVNGSENGKGLTVPAKKKSQICYTDIFARTAVEMARKHPSIVAITAAMPSGTGLNKFQEALPERFYDVGIAEAHAVTFAAGLARGGLRPIVAVYSTFLQRAVDQLIHDVCLQDLPVIFCLDRAGVVGADGATHQGLFDIAYLRATPNIVLLAPADERELAEMMWTAFEYGHPVAIRYPRDTVVGIPTRPGGVGMLPIGRGTVVREGTDVALFALGPLLYSCLEAAEELERQGIDCRVINPRSAKPVDRRLITSAAEDGLKIVTVEEHALQGGFGSAVLEALHEEGHHGTELLRLGVPDRFIEHGPRSQILDELGLTSRGITASVAGFVTESVPAHTR